MDFNTLASSEMHEARNKAFQGLRGYIKQYHSDYLDDYLACKGEASVSWLLRFLQDAESGGCIAKTSVYVESRTRNRFRELWLTETQLAGPLALNCPELAKIHASSAKYRPFEGNEALREAKVLQFQYFADIRDTDAAKGQRVRVETETTLTASEFSEGYDYSFQAECIKRRRSLRRSLRRRTTSSIITSYGAATSRSQNTRADRDRSCKTKKRRRASSLPHQTRFFHK